MLILWAFAGRLTVGALAQRQDRMLSRLYGYHTAAARCWSNYARGGPPHTWVCSWLAAWVRSKVREEAETRKGSSLDAVMANTFRPLVFPFRMSENSNSRTSDFHLSYLFIPIVRDCQAPCTSGS